MADLTLIVTRHDTTLTFVLLSKQGEFAPTPTMLTDKDREDLEADFKPFRDLSLGNLADHEGDLAEIGKQYFRKIIPGEIAEKIRGTKSSLLIQTNDCTLPWPHFHDGTDFLGMGRPFALKMMRERPRAVESGMPQKSMLIIADTHGDLKSAKEEGDHLKQLFPNTDDCVYLNGQEATRERIRRALQSNEYRYIHICSHVRNSPKGEGAVLPTADAPILAEELAGWTRGRPVVFVHGCEADFHEEGGVDGPFEGMVMAFLKGSEFGSAAAVVGAMWKVPEPAREEQVSDTGAPLRRFVVNFYERLLEGKPIGEALLSSQRDARGGKWGPSYWAPYKLYADDPDWRPYESPDPRSAPSTIDRILGLQPIPLISGNYFKYVGLVVALSFLAIFAEIPEAIRHGFADLKTGILSMMEKGRPSKPTQPTTEARAAPAGPTNQQSNAVPRELAALVPLAAFLSVIPGQTVHLRVTGVGAAARVNEVRWSAPAKGATCIFNNHLSEYTSHTGASNVAETTCIAMGEPGAKYEIEAESGAATTTLNVQNVPQPALLAVAGEGQAAVPGRMFPVKLVVEASGDDGPVPGLEIEFSVDDSHASFQNGETSGSNSVVRRVTDEHGRATATAVKAGEFLGPVKVQAVAGDDRVPFNLTVGSSRQR